MTLQGKENTEELYFDVEHSHVSKYGFEGITGRDHCVVVRPQEDKKIISLCSKDYELVRNEEIFPEIEKSLPKGFKVKCKNYNDAQFSVNYICEHENIDLPGGDKLVMMINLQHSYDARRKFSGNVDVLRKICDNGLTVPYEGEFADMFKLEMTGVHSHDNVMTMIKDFGLWLPNVADKFKIAVKETYKPLYENQIVSYAERIEEVVATTGVFSTKLVDIAVSIAETEEVAAKLPRTDWLAYNAINSLLFDDEVNKKADFERRKLDIKVVNHMLATI